jgi:uncharacterized coiled-coil protein SlyX
MKKAMEIKSEVDKTDSRITELETELSEQTATFEATQAAFVSGKTNIDELHAEQSKLTLVSQAIEALKATYQKLKSAFDNQSAQERRTELLKQMATAANEVEPLVNDYLQTRNEFNDVVSKYAETLINKATAYRNKQAEYQSIVRELQPTDAEIQESGLEQKTLTMASATYFNHPPMGTFTEAVALAENLLAAKINKAAQAKRQAEFSARTMERTEKAFAEQAATN